MKLLIASDIHGSALYCGELLKAYDREKADRLLLLGDDVFETISTSSWVVICMGILGASVHLIGGHVDWGAAIPLTIGATCGALIAPHVARFITRGGRAKWLEGALGVALVAMGIRNIV